MHSIGLDDVGSALLITLALLVASVAVVGLSMWWLYRFFKNSNDTAKSGSEENATQDNQEVK